jgi:hypothetical protein
MREQIIIVVAPGFDLKATIRTAVDHNAILILEAPEPLQPFITSFNIPDFEAVKAKEVKPTALSSVDKWSNHFRQAYHSRKL